MFADNLNFSDTDTGRVAIVVTEITGNLIKHAKGGEVILQVCSHNGVDGLEILGLDKGPGAADYDKWMTDGYSTSGTPGTGLGAVLRMSSAFDILSTPGKGTAVYAGIWPTERPPRVRDRGAVSLPIKGEVVNGDGWNLQKSADGNVVLVADGLGHGSDAHKASQEALRIFNQHYAEDLINLMERIHNALRVTRGAAVAISNIDLFRKTISFCGMGNIVAAICSHDKHRNMVSMNGTAGQSMARCRVFDYPWENGDLLVMHSDGLGTHWDLKDYPGLWTKHPTLIAGVLYRDHSRRRDDATVFVIRLKTDAASP